jgi:DNA-binding LacI/PurR family transcriptional regulator
LTKICWVIYLYKQKTKMNNKIQLDISKPSPLHHLVKKKILELIRDGTLKDGDRLPPEETIAEENGISRGTVRAALLELAREGIITRYPKRGTFLTIKRSLKAKHIGVISPLLSLTVKEKSDFYQNELLGGLQNGFIGTGASLLFYQNNLKSNEDIESLYEKNVDGILFLLPLKSQLDMLVKLQKRKIPLMIAGATPEGDFNFVGTDNRKGTESAVNFLVSQGHKKIGAIFSNLDYFDNYYRYQSFLDSLKKFSLPYQKEWIRILPRTTSEKWSDESLKMAEEILNSKEKPTAIITGGGFISLGAKKAIEDRGLTIPNDISLIGFDDFYSAEYLTPPLTIISQPIWEIGELAVKKLVGIISNKISSPCQVLLKPKLIKRNSVIALKR